MGYSCAFRNACAVTATLVLIGCNPPARESEVDDLQTQIHNLQSQVAVLEDKLATVERDTREDIQSVRALGLENARNADSLTDTFNDNVEIANKAAAARMTARGACGTVIEPLETGGVIHRNKECTVDDLSSSPE